MSRIFNFLLAACAVAFSALGQTAFKAVTVNTNTGIFGAGALGSGVKLTLNNGVVSNSTVRDSILTNISVFGQLIIDSGDELQDTVDYSLALTPNGNTPTENDASPRPRSVATIASLVADVDPLLVPDYSEVNVLGYYTSIDGGGGKVRRVLFSSVAGTKGTNGVWFQSSFNPAYAWKRVILDDTVTSRQWGLTDGTDDLVALQAFVDYTAENNLTAYLDDGSYVLTNSLVLPSNLKLVGTYNSVFERAAVSSQTNLHTWSALKTAYTFNPYITNGGFTGSTVPGLVTNVTLKGFRLKTADNYHSSFGIAAFCAQDWLLEDLTVDRMTNHWAITYFGNDIRTHNCVINNGGSVFQDGLHVIGGDKLVFTGNVVNSGDDSYALTTGYLQQQDISNVTISGNIANSTHGHAVRLAIENFSGTNRIYNIVVDGLTGYAGLEKNALVRFESNSTNVLYGITNVSLAHIRLKGGDLADHGGTFSGADYGYHIHNADEVVITDCHVGPTVLWNYYLKNCGRISLTDCTGDGAQYTSLNATMHVDGVEELIINGGRYRNSSGVASDTIWIKDGGRVSMTGVTVENTVTNRAALTLFGTALESFSAVNNTFTNSGGYAFTSYTNPDRIVLVGNTFGSVQGVAWQGGSPPSVSAIANNLGLSGGSAQAATEYAITTSSGAYLGGVGSRSARIRFASTNGIFVFAQDDLDGTAKTARIGGQSYTISNQPIAAFVTQDTGASPSLNIGGGTALMSGPATMDFYTAAGYAAGTSRMRLNTAGLVIEPAGVASAADASAALDVRSTTQGLLLPRTTATPSSAADGLIWYRSDTDVLALRANGATVDVVSTPSTSPSTGQILVYTNSTWAAMTPGASGIGGSTGSTDNRLLRADGTGGSTVQNSAVLVDDFTSSTANNVAIKVDDGSTANISAVVTPKGTGAFILGPKPDGTTTGGNARGAGAVDLSMSRALASSVASGQYAVTATYEASASGTAAVGVGYSANVSGNYAFVGGGFDSTASGSQAGVVGGLTTVASGEGAVGLGGQGATASGKWAVATGTAVANKQGQVALTGGSFSTAGDSQTTFLTARNSTSSTTPTVLFLDGSSAYITIPSNTTWTFTALLTGATASGAATYSYRFDGVIVNAAGTTTLLAGGTPTVIYESNAAADATCVGNNTNDSLDFTVTAANSTATRWSVSVTANQLSY